MTLGAGATSPSKGGRASSDRRPWDTAGLLVCLLLLAGAMLLPWWSIAATSPSGAASFDFGLASLCLRPSGVCTSYGTLAASDPAYRSLRDVFAVALPLESVALVGTLLAFVLAMFRGRFPAGRAGVGLFGLVAGIAALAAPLNVLFALPAAVTALPFASAVTGFSGSVTADGGMVTWGGGPGWTLSLAASGLILLSGPGTLAFRRRTGKTKV